MTTSSMSGGAKSSMVTQVSGFQNFIKREDISNQALGH